MRFQAGAAGLCGGLGSDIEDSQGIPAGRGEGGTAAFESSRGKRGGRRHITDPASGSLNRQKKAEKGKN